MNYYELMVVIHSSESLSVSQTTKWTFLFAAFIIFEKAEVDIAILEVGLGGRLDSVNVVDSDVSIITNIAII